jgi:hypothetical protein
MGERVQPANKAELRLPHSSKFKRMLALEIIHRGFLSVRVVLSTYVNVCSSILQLERCYLDISVPDCMFLAMGDTCFMLTPKEAMQIRATFEPLGLRVRETDQ